MRCNVCGRELKPGQMFCQCGNTVGDDPGGQLNVNAPSSAKTLVIGAAAGFLLLVVIAVGAFTLLGRGRAQVTDRTKWEHISGSGFQMTVPGGMEEADVFEPTNGFLRLTSLRSSEVIIGVSSLSYDASGSGTVNRRKLEEMFRSALKAQAPIDDVGEPQEHGNMIYYDYTEQASGLFAGTDQLHVVDGMFVGNSAVYEVCIACAEPKYGDYEEYIFAWFDSFKGE